MMLMFRRHGAYWQRHQREGAVTLPVMLEATAEAPVPVEYRWDPDTDILSARLMVPCAPGTPDGCVDLEGSDGSWLIFDTAAGRIRGVEIAVWPSVRRCTELAPPRDVEDAQAVLDPPRRGEFVSALEVDAALAAEADQAERTIHFRVGPGRRTRTVRIARDILLDVDGNNRLVGLWLLDVPPLTPEEP